MHVNQKITRALFCAVLWTGCSTVPNATTDRLPAPHLLPSPPDTALVEEGIDAVEFGDFIQLDWRPRGEARPFQYKIYRRSEKDQAFTMLVKLSGSVQSFIDSLNVQVGRRYYYYITALNDDEVESLPSDTLSYMLLEKAFLLSNTASPVPVFSWQVSTSPETFVLKLIEADTGEKVWVTQIKSSYSQMEQIVFNADGSSRIDSLRRNVTYKWRIDIVGPSMNSGSESQWKRFTIQ